MDQRDNSLPSISSAKNIYSSSVSPYIKNAKKKQEELKQKRERDYRTKHLLESKQYDDDYSDGTPKKEEHLHSPPPVTDSQREDMSPDISIKQILIPYQPPPQKPKIRDESRDRT